MRRRTKPEKEPKRKPRVAQSVKVKASFVAIVVIATVLLGLLFRDDREIRQLTKDNKNAIMRLSTLEVEQAQFRAQRIKQTSATDTLICQQLNQVKAVIRGVVVPKRSALLKIPYYRTHPDQIQTAIDAGQAIAGQFAPINCNKLPSRKIPVIKKPKPPKKSTRKTDTTNQ